MPEKCFLDAQQVNRLRLVNTPRGQLATLEERYRVVYDDGFGVRGRVCVLGYVKSMETNPLLPIGAVLNVEPVGEGHIERRDVYEAVKALGHGYGETFPIYL